MFMSPSRLKESLAQLDDELCSQGRDPASFGRAILLFVSVGQRSARTGLAWLSSLYRLDGQRLERYLIAGSADECVAMLTEYRSAGATHLALFFTDDEPIGQLAALVERGNSLLEEGRCGRSL
jgi:alkanesulfonate monooxygenase SsuD/methylene tetrahydromethanopterin reductase-like flavin-dependent oxidoreductase (luciferase family)